MGKNIGLKIFALQSDETQKMSPSGGIISFNINGLQIDNQNKQLLQVD